MCMGPVPHVKLRLLLLFYFSVSVEYAALRKTFWMSIQGEPRALN